MAQPLDRLRGSKAVRLLFSLALVAGLWPATSLAAPRPAYADDSAAPSVDVEGYVKAQADSGKVGEEKAGFLFWGGQELHGTGKYLTVKHTYAQNLEEGDTISSIMTDARRVRREGHRPCTRRSSSSTRSTGTRTTTSRSPTRPRRTAPPRARSISRPPS